MAPRSEARNCMVGDGAATWLIWFHDNLKFVDVQVMEKSVSKKDVYQLFAEKVRDNKQLESRWAIMQETRVEYFRGKDFNTFIKNHPEVREILGPDKDLEVEDIVSTLLTKNLVIRFSYDNLFRSNYLNISACYNYFEIRHHAPDEAARARYQKKVSNIIDDVLEWSPKLAISGMIEKHTGANITEDSNYTSRAASSHVPPSTKDKASEAGPDMDADGDTEANLDETQDNEYADDTRSSEA
ncbi:unnamed protein product [Miscanthus lutarioriparius]|uniref:Translocation protein SEC62 n=1 Tax=Miscanthus lutarioriparius TaxID=422564 RepID=A0A811S0X4_9POAL|nr:unnamed protein product [Miscanthus lutarioriparius]